MSKDELALQLTKAILKSHASLESFNSYQCIKSYFLSLESEDLVGIATQYDIDASRTLPMDTTPLE